MATIYLISNSAFNIFIEDELIELLNANKTSNISFIKFKNDQLNEAILLTQYNKSNITINIINALKNCKKLLKNLNVLKTNLCIHLS